jgi:ABC-2 type transport system ATP-binding protein
MPTSIITVTHLTKKFKDFAAVNDISFTVTKKEIFAFLGPNGAGKSTTIKMLITLLKPTSGEAVIDEFSIVHHPGDVRRVIGYIPQMISVDGTLTAYENLMLMAKLYDIPSGVREKRIADVLEFLELAPLRNTLVRNFSGGMIRKLEVGQAILHRPPVLFLDEPTSGLDPIARRNVWKHLHDLRDTFGTTIFFTTHYMEEAEEVCDRVAIMHNGVISAIGSVPELKTKTGSADATLEDAFIFFTGATLQTGGTFRDVRRARTMERKLG